MKDILRIRLIINWQTFLVCILASISTYYCVQYGITAKFPLTLIGTAVIFPIVFSIGGAYKRRESVLNDYGNLKAHGRAIYFASRDWVPETTKELEDGTKQDLLNLFVSLRKLFHTGIEKMEEEESYVYKNFSKLSERVANFRKFGLPSGEASRCNQFISKMLVSFEHIKHVYQYRTPRTLRSYSKLFIFVLPVAYGPYFAEISKEFHSYLEFAMPVFFSIVLVCLDNIQDHLENPFDLVGEDDVKINAEKFIERLDLK